MKRRDEEIMKIIKLNVEKSLNDFFFFLNVVCKYND